LIAAFQVRRTFSVFAASSYLPWFGRSSWTETGCIQILPRPCARVMFVARFALAAGFRLPQLEKP
jgi:hypothetical protein